MRLLVSDQESGIMGDACNLWLDRQQIQVKTKEPGTHAYIVERHHDLLHRVLHTTEAQLAEEGIDMPFEVTLAECQGSSEHHAIIIESGRMRWPAWLR